MHFSKARWMCSLLHISLPNKGILVFIHSLHPYTSLSLPSEPRKRRNLIGHYISLYFQEIGQRVTATTRAMGKEETRDISESLNWTRHMMKQLINLNKSLVRDL